jgi:hypothetical protein
MTAPKFITRRRWLTSYALACGYVETQAQDVINKGTLEWPDFKGVSVSMWLDCGVYHIRVHNHTEGQRVLWECKDTLPEARKFFSQCLKAHKLSRKMNF